jgi:ribosome biogenesis protein
MDHSIKITDIPTLKPTTTFLTKDSITTSISHHNSTNILTSHEDGYVRLWDLRHPSSPSITFKGHSKLISQVQYNVKKGNIFATGSYDTSIKVWDVRSTFPIQTVSAHQDKVFGVLWKDEKELIGGGADGEVSWNGIKD